MHLEFLNIILPFKYCLLIKCDDRSVYLMYLSQLCYIVNVFMCIFLCHAFNNQKKILSEKLFTFFVTCRRKSNTEMGLGCTLEFSLWDQLAYWQ